jgi:hypothetical protein
VRDSTQDSFVIKCRVHHLCILEVVFHDNNRLFPLAPASGTAEGGGDGEREGGGSVGGGGGDGGGGDGDVAGLADGLNCRKMRAVVEDQIVVVGEHIVGVRFHLL